jgi:hypothetical protein
MVDFDALVRAMRAARTTEGIMVLYEQVFRLEEWFLPNAPDQPLGNPMQWRFEEGLDPTPCILAYTNLDLAKRQADKVAASFGKGGEVMTIAVENAVNWMLSGDLGVTWACFNFGATSENFPLHLDQLETLAAKFGVRTSSKETFFPAEYKEFPFREGDLLASPRSDGKIAISKVLKIDKIIVRTGESISIQGQRFTAPVEDFLLVISCALGESEFASVDHARAAAASNKWTIRIGHVPNRAPGAAEGKIVVGSAPVTEKELTGYRMWREAFDKGDAGIF